MERLDRFRAGLAPHAPRAPAVLRWGLGVVIFLAGAHKLVAPGAWAVYTAPWFERLWPLSLRVTMVVAGLTEVPFGVLLVADRYTTVSAAVVAVSMAGVVGYLGAVALTTGQFVDVLIRDSAILALAVGVTLQSAGGARTA